jgi:hypothetical protein
LESRYEEIALGTKEEKKGEKDLIGRHVPEQYLDDREDLKGRRPKVLCRVMLFQ